VTDSVAGAVTASTAAASQSLRDTAKWLVGGVVTTAAGVFAGSSLTSLGSLDLTNDRNRLIAAGVGILVGFTGLATILVLAIRVLERGSITFRELCTRSDEFSKISTDLLTRYQSDMSRHGAADFKSYQAQIDDAYVAKNPSDEQKKILLQAPGLTAIISADAGFQLVRRRFDCLIRGLILGSLLSIAGFGVFAWAANPPKPITQTSSADATNTKGQ
jgi:hypothetical protein